MGSSGRKVPDTASDDPTAGRKRGMSRNLPEDGGRHRTDPKFSENGEICVQILDDGAGFDTEKLKDADGIAIRNLKLRLKEFLNADLEIESRKGEGCRQTIHIPWEETDDENYSDR